MTHYKKYSIGLLLLIVLAITISYTTKSFSLFWPKDKIVVVGHFYPLFKQEYLVILREQLQKINGLTGMVFAGDMVPFSNEKNFNLLKTEIGDRLNLPIYYIPANHEMSDENIFNSEAKKFASLNNRNVYVDDTKFVLFTTHKQNLRPARSKVDCNSAYELRKLILEKATEVRQTYLVLADLKCFRKPLWKEIVHPLIRKHIFAVIIGDNAPTKYTYTWEHYLGVPFIFQGITHRGHGLSGDNTFLIVNKKNIAVRHLAIDNALDNAYKTKNKFKKLKDK